MANHSKPILTLLALLAMLTLHASHDPIAIVSAATTEVYVAHHTEPMADQTIHHPTVSRRKLVRRSESRGGGTNPALERSQSFTQTDCRVRWTDSCSNGTGSGGSGGYINGGYGSGYDPAYNTGYPNGGSRGSSGTSSDDDRDHHPSGQGSSESGSPSPSHDERRKRRHLVDAGHPSRGMRRRQLGQRMDTSGQIDRRYVPMSGGIGGQFPKESAQGRR
ncbi:hypothetical protein DFQ26_006237 [Actinomortierella ambigua]|nr:hypothetical protein DFQ26_006237 [Actinomortierella ambigua]